MTNKENSCTSSPDHGHLLRHVQQIRPEFRMFFILNRPSIHCTRFVYVSIHFATSNKGCAGEGRKGTRSIVERFNGHLAASSLSHNKGGVARLSWKIRCSKIQYFSKKISKLWWARSLLYRGRFLGPNTHFSAFFVIYKIQNPLHRSKPKTLQILANVFDNFCLLLKICKERERERERVVEFR